MPKRSSIKTSKIYSISGQPNRKTAFQEVKDAILTVVNAAPDQPILQARIEVEAKITPLTSEFVKSVLLQDFIIRQIRALRRKQSAADHRQMVLPGIELMPATIPSAQTGRQKALMEAVYRDVRDYCKSLSRQAAERARHSKKLKQAEALRDLMHRYAAEERGITVRQVLLLEAGKPKPASN